MNRRWASHSSTYPSSCTTNSLPRSSTSDLSAPPSCIPPPRHDDDVIDDDDATDEAVTSSLLLQPNSVEMPPHRHRIRGNPHSRNYQDAPTPKNIERYRRRFADWSRASPSDDDEDEIGTGAGDGGSGRVRFPPTVPQRHLLVVNVSGRKFELDTRRLSEHPETLLGDAKMRARYYDPHRREIFLDRHQKSFEAIHNYYMGLSTGGNLIRPDDVPLDIFLNEVRFYRFGREAIREFLLLEGILLDKKVKVMPDTELKRIIWRIFEDHDSSWEARIITLLSACIITLSVIVFCLETLPDFASLDKEFKKMVEPSLQSCVRHLNTSGDASLGARLGAREPMPGWEFVQDVRVLLEKCEGDQHMSAEDRYFNARCLVHFNDEGTETVASLISNLTDDDVTTATSRHRRSVTRHLRHRSAPPSGVVDDEGASGAGARIGGEGELEVPPSERGWSYDGDGLRALKRACVWLDGNSQRSPYFWYVLESRMNLPAGNIFLIETSCIVWFVLEIVLRFYCSPTRRSFFMNFLNIIDVLAILPYFITLIITTIAVESSLRPQTATILRTIRLVRMLRILKLSRYSRGFRILGLTLVRSTRVLFLLVCFQVVLAIFFSSIGYFVENETTGTKFTSIPESFWWALITMTTVGYGDICPITLWGKITGACCAIMGILSISFPVPVIVSNFNYLYNQDKDDCKLEPEELMNEEVEDDKCPHAEIFSRFERFSNLKARRETVKSTDEKEEKTPVLLWDLVKEHYTKRSHMTPPHTPQPTPQPNHHHPSDPSTSNRGDDVITHHDFVNINDGLGVTSQHQQAAAVDDVTTTTTTVAPNHHPASGNPPPPPHSQLLKGASLLENC